MGKIQFLINSEWSLMMDLTASVFHCPVKWLHLKWVAKFPSRSCLSALCPWDYRGGSQCPWSLCFCDRCSCANSCLLSPTQEFCSEDSEPWAPILASVCLSQGCFSSRNSFPLVREQRTSTPDTIIMIKFSSEITLSKCFENMATKGEYSEEFKFVAEFPGGSSVAYKHTPYL